MRRTVSAILAGLLAAGTITAAVTPAHASPAVNWHQRTCTAFRAWDAHRTPGRLHAMVADSFHVAPKYLGADVAGLYADAEGGHAKYLGEDATFVNQDCGG